jgi:hypothetical protein
MAPVPPPLLGLSLHSGQEGELPVIGFGVGPGNPGALIL